MSQPVVWRASVDEAEIVAQLLIEFRNWSGRSWPSDNAFLAAVEQLMEDHRTEFLLGAPSRDSPPSGVCQLRYRYSIWMAADDCWLEDLYVRESARRQGVGRALVQTAFEHAAGRGCRRIELDVNEQNREALLLYEALGFSGASKHSKGRDLLMGRQLGT